MSTCMDRLPLELTLKIAEHLSLRDHATCLLSCRQVERSFKQALCTRLLPLHLSNVLDGDGRDSFRQNDTVDTLQGEKWGRKDVLRWAIEHGSVATLVSVNATEAVEPFINSMSFPTSMPGSQESERQSYLCLSMLQLACMKGHCDVVYFLLDHGGNVNQTLDRTYGLLPIHFATTAELIEILVLRGSSIPTGGTVSPLAISLCCGGDVSAVRSFLEMGCSPRDTTPDGITAAVSAIKNEDADTLQILIDLGADITKPLPQGEHPLYHAIWLAQGNPDHKISLRLLRMLLDHGADANSGHKHVLKSPGHSPEECYTPYLLLATMMSGTADIVSLLLSHGADVNCRFTERRMLLDPRARSLPYFRCTFDMAETLIGNLVAAIINTPPEDSDESLINPDFLLKFDALIAHGASMDGFWWFNNYDGRTTKQPLVFLELLPRLLRLGADVNHLGGKPGTDCEDKLLHFIIGKLYSKVQNTWTSSQMYCDIRLRRRSLLSEPMKITLDHGGDANSAGNSRLTPLMLFCSQQPSMAAALLMRILLDSCEIDVNAKDIDSDTALHYASRIPWPRGEADLDFCFRLQLLLKHSQVAADINTRDVLGRTPLHGILENGGSSLNSKKLDSYSTLHPERRALVMLIRSGADTTARAVPPPLLLSHMGIFRYNLQSNNMIDVFGPDADGVWENNGSYEGLGDTPLHMVCQRRLDPTIHIELLLRYGATRDVNAVSRKLWLTPLMTLVGFAANGNVRREAMIRAVRLLVDAGANTQALDTKGRTAWEISMEINNAMPSWLWGLYIEDIMPEMSDERRKELLGLDARNYSSFEQREATV